MTQTASVLVAILNFNTKGFLEKFIPAVKASTYSNFEILLIDNGSSDDSLSFMRSHHADVRIKALPKNLGFAGGYVAGLQDETADYFVLLNTDVEVPPHWIEPVVSAMELDENIAAAQPKILSYNEAHLFEYAGAAGGLMDIFAYPFCQGRLFNHCEKDNGQYNPQREIFWASGAALFIKSKYWLKSGGLDVDFFAHMEEIDLCWRLKNMGYKIIYVPDSRIYHVGGGTLARENPRKTELNFRNALICMVKNMSWQELIWKTPIKLVLDGLGGFHFLLKGQWRSTLAIIKAHFAFHGRLWYWLKKRKQVERIKHPNNAGRYRGSVVYAYFIKKRTLVSDLKWKY
jgi:hypothetical protein